MRKPNNDIIEKEFAGTNFGGDEQTVEGRAKLCAECVMKTVCGFSSGHTITEICKEVGLLTTIGNAKKWAKRWAYCYIFDPFILDCGYVVKAICLETASTSWLRGYKWISNKNQATRFDFETAKAAANVFRIEGAEINVVKC